MPDKNTPFHDVQIAKVLHKNTLGLSESHGKNEKTKLFYLHQANNQGQGK
jgi:hypothetical protein